MKVTQIEIARMAHCSQATVSRVMAGDPRVDPDIVRRVQAILAERNARRGARAPRRAGMLGLVVRRRPGGLSSDPFYSVLTAELASALIGTPYRLCLEVVSGEDEQELSYSDLTRHRKVDGLVLVESELDDARMQMLLKEDFPFVLIGKPVGLAEGQSVLSVDNDNFSAGELATTHLYEAGYRRIAMLAGRNGVTFSDDRVAGYERAIEAVGGTPRVFHSEFGAEEAKRVALEMLRADDRPDAIVVVDDYMAMGVVFAAREVGVAIPDALGVASYNDTSICRHVEYGLTSINLNIAQIVHIAVGRLLRRLEGLPTDEPARMIVPVKLHARGSSRGPSLV